LNLVYTVYLLIFIKLFNILLIINIFLYKLVGLAINKQRLNIFYIK
jgi:hypothetical protein